MSVDLLYLCHGRIEFTKTTLANLITTTDWSLVDSFVVYNDSAPDGHETTKLLHEMVGECGEIRLTNLRSPVGVMNHFLWRSKAEMFAKIDNDIMAPPGWLEALLSVMEDEPHLELLGMEAGMSGVRTPDEEVEVYSYTEASNIGGVGLMRRRAFDDRPWPQPNGRFGFTEWQHRHRPRRGWIAPDLKVFSLDKLPFEPWESLTRRYLGNEGLQRDWPKYDARATSWLWEWAAPTLEAA